MTLCESFFLKKELISEKIVLFLYIGIGLIVCFVWILKYTNFLRHAGASMPFLFYNLSIFFTCET